MITALTPPDLGLVVLPLALACVALILLAALYNSLAIARVRVKNAFSQIDVQLRRRHDLIPNLVQATRGYMDHERATLQAVIQARATAEQAMGGLSGNGFRGVRALAIASFALDGALRGLMARIEAYPELKASAVIGTLQEELVTTENRVAFARQAFNDAVMRFNERVVTFPSNLIAGWFGFEQSELWETESGTREVPSASFGSNA